jgi:hypothetical protein
MHNTPMDMVEGKIESEKRKEEEMLKHLFTVLKRILMRQPKCSHTRQASQGKKKRNGPGRPWTLKLNCDATFLEATKSGGWGWLIRNSNGEVIIVGRGRVDHVHNPDEVISCMHGANGYLPLVLTIWSSKLMH